MGFTYLPADDPSIESFRGVFLKVRRALGTNAFGLNEIRLPPGAEGLEHDETETGHEEVYAVLEGSGSFTVDGDRIEVAAGDYLRVDPGSTRLAVAGDDGMRFLAIAATPRPEYDGRPSL
jgi:quercetin dioxygenase-like cupin family protein